MSEEINFKSLNIKIPPNVKTYTIEKQREIYDYLSTLEEHHKVAYNIAF